MKLADLDTFLYFPEDFTKGDVISKAKMVSPTEARSIDGENKTIIIAKFDDCETKLIVDRRTGHVRGACTCLDYDKGKPCMHIACLFEEFGKGAIEQKVAPTKKQRVFREEGKAEGSEGTAENSEDVDKSKAIESARQMLESKAVEKAERIDELIILEEWVEGSEPLIYTIPTKKGEKIILSVKGYVQAALMQGHIEVLDVEFKEINDRLVAIAKVRDKQHDLIMTGVAERYFNEEYKYTILARKAVRNALKNIIKPEIEQLVIKEAKRLNSMLDLREAATP